MSLVSQIFSLQSGLDSLGSSFKNFGIDTSSDKHPEKPAPSLPLFDFLQAASASGLRQYAQDIAEEGLIAARLGDGADYVVDKVKSPNGEIVVVKHVKATLSPDGAAGDSDIEDSSRIRKVLHEIKIATHPVLRENANILRMMGFGWEMSESSLTTPFLVVEYAEHGTLRNYLQKIPQSVSMETKLSLAFDAAKGLRSLHAQHIAHGDLKLENALVTIAPKDPTLKITDFGLSVVINDDETSYQYWGTQRYRPPEVYQQTGDSDTAGWIAGSKYRACDVYTYGLLVLEILIDGEQYLEHMGEAGQIDEQSQALRCLSSVSDSDDVTLTTLKSIAQKCLHIDVEARPRIEKVVSEFEGANQEGDVEDIAPLTFSEIVSSQETSSAGNMNQMFATLAGYELDNGSAQLAPWKVQEMVAEGLQQRTNHHNFEIASRACLELGLCHYLGFGVERDQSKVLQYFDQAAAKGCFEARRIRHRLYEAFSESMGDLDILVEVDKQEERQLQRLLEAELRSADVNPFQVFDEVAQEDFRSQMGDSELSLHQVAYIGNVARIRKLLRDGSDFQDDQGRTALFLAVQGQHLDAMRMLLELGNSDPSLPDENGHTALHMLIMLSNVDVEAGLSLMLQFSPESDLNAFSSSLLDASEHWGELWGAPLHWAVLAGNKAMTSCLVKAGARVHDWPQESCPVRIAASLHLSEILEILLSAIPPGVSLRGSNPFFALNSSNPFRRLLLHGKNYVLQIEKTISILTRKYPVIDKQEGSWNGNPLRKVLTVNFSDSDRYIAKALVEAGAFKDDYEGLTLLQSAIIGCHGSPMSSICRMALDMIEIQQDFRQRSNEHRTGWTALHWAAAGGLVPVVTMLLQVDQDSIDLRTEDEEERTPLHLAAESGKSIAMINLLLKHGADACLTTSGLRLTPLGSFVSNQRSELNVDILKALLEASKTTGYLAFSSDNWNVLHYAATRAALLDAESLPGHLLLRTLATMPEMKSLIESTTAQGWTALHLAAYLVDYTTIRLLVDEFNANVQTQNPKAATAFDIVLEIARRFPEGLRGADSVSRWSRLAYRSALYLQAKLEAIEGPYHLTPLHLAAYIGYHDEVVRLVQKEPDAVFETNWEGETPRQMLQNTMPVDVSADWAARFRTIAEKVCGVLESKELELEEESEQAWIASHQMSL